MMISLPAYPSQLEPVTDANGDSHTERVAIARDREGTARRVPRAGALAFNNLPQERAGRHNAAVTSAGISASTVSLSPVGSRASKGGEDRPISIAKTPRGTPPAAKDLRRKPLLTLGWRETPHRGAEVRVRTTRFTASILVQALFVLIAGTPAYGQQAPAQVQPEWLRDRGEGVSTSIFATYVTGGELLVSPFFEYYRDRNYEYSPSELGVPGDVDFRGRYRAHEGLLWLAYGVTDDVAVEFEMAVIKATLEKAANDSSALPLRMEESGLGDVEGQIRWRWRRETESRAELFSYGEWVAPHDRDKPLIGTADWEFKFGTGLVRGFGWGTLTARGAVEYDAGSSSEFDLGEYAVEYVRRLSPQWRVYAGVEGTQDEVELIGEAQWHMTPTVYVRLNLGVGVTSKATDLAPDIGVVFSFGGR
jgi:hypothetical protein